MPRLVRGGTVGLSKGVEVGTGGGAAVGVVTELAVRRVVGVVNG